MMVMTDDDYYDVSAECGLSIAATGPLVQC